jgi:TonB-dependent receptor
VDGTTPGSVKRLKMPAIPLGKKEEDVMKVKSQLMIGIAGVSIFASPALAQNATVASTGAPAAEEIVVTGIRASQRASIDVKRLSSVIVDVVTATDVGKFPDPNIADSLQRVTGVSIDRSGGEGRYITVRGFGPQYNNVLVNGRTMATDNNGREFSFDTLSSSLISRAEVFKTYQPQLQEGGIGATVNISTARPLDGKSGLHVAGHAGGTYDFLAKKTSPDAGALATFKTADGMFGVEASLTYTDRKSQDDYTDTNGWFSVSPAVNPLQVINGTPTSTGLTPANIVSDTRSLSLPQNLNFKRNVIDSQRLTGNLTVQFKPSNDLLITVDGLFSNYKIKDRQNFFAGYFSPPYFSNLTADSNGTTTGFTRPGTNFATANPLLAADGRFSNQQNDNVVQDLNRNSKSYQIGGNIKWNATNNVKFEADLSKSHATQDFYNPFVVVGAQATGAPVFTLGAAGSIPSYDPASNITDPKALRTHYTNVSDSKYADDITEARLQGEWKAEAGLLQSIQFGGLYSRREKTDTEYRTPLNNWCAYCGYVVPIDQNLVSPYTLSNYLTSSAGSGSVPQQFFTFDPAAVIAYESLPSTLALRSAGQLGNVPTAQFTSSGGYAPSLQALNGFDVTEKVFAGYINTNWKGSVWSGNLGLRISDTSTTSSGVIQPLTRIQQNVGDSNLNFTLGAQTPVTVTNHYVNFLPSANIKIDLAKDLIIRYAISKTLTRPTLSQLGTNNSYGGRVTQALSSGGNPSLKPFTSWNFDASLEWYLDRNTSFTVDGFRKQFSGFISNQTVVVPRNGFDSLGNAVVYQFFDTRPRNGNSGSVTGFEVAAQHAFSGEGFLSGFGVGANYTHVTSNQKVISPGDCSQIEGLSDSYNVNAFYEKHGIQARVAYNHRASFLSLCQGQQGQPENTAPYGQLDFNTAYDITPNFQVYLEGVNMTNSYIHQYSIYANRFLKDESTGRRISFGVRAKF